MAAREQAGCLVEELGAERMELEARHGAERVSPLLLRRLAPMAPKTITGAELELDDGPARGSELFLVDGNNLAYRAFFALPEELATSDGLPTNALLGFGNMLFKLLADYGPRGVAVAWDTRPVHRAAVAEAVDVVYKQGRKPMPDLLREQFPYFRPIVEAFGYRNLEFEGWEADDVIATIATLADEAGVKTCVVSTDRDAFQLCSENVTLMMTPRGVSDVNVYTPERVELRYGVRPDQVPDFIGLKGDTSDNIPGIPGIGDKTAGQLIAQYGSLEEVIAHADELSPARGKAVREHADQARASKELATMRRDLPLGVDPTALVSGAPGPLPAEGDVPPLRVPRPAQPGRRRSTRRCPAQERPKLGVARRVGLARGRRCARRSGPGWRGDRGGRIAVASDAGVLVADWDPANGLAAARSRPRRPRREGAAPAVRPRRRHDDRRLPDRARPLRLPDSTTSPPSTGSSSSPSRPRKRRPPRSCGTPRSPGGSPRRCASGSSSAARSISTSASSFRSRPSSQRWRTRASSIDTYRMGEITARLRDRVEELEARATDLAGEEFMLGSTQQVGRILFEKLGLEPGRKGKTGYSTDSRVLRGSARTTRSCR